MTVFADRAAAGAALADHLGHLADSDVVVLGLPRGGVPVAAEVAGRLGAPLDIVVVRKLGMPGQPELAMGAVASGGGRVLNPSVASRVTDERLEEVTARERAEVERRERDYRGGRPPPELAGRVVVLVDDGLATGSSMRAAVSAVREQGAARVVAAVPVGAPAACPALAELADEVVCVEQPANFFAVGQFYDDFDQTSDDEVRRLLRSPPRSPGQAVPAGP